MKGKTMGYTLTAKLEGTGTSRVTFYEDNDTRATSAAIGIILDRAMNNTIWAKGSIELRNANGEIVQTMEAK